MRWVKKTRSKHFRLTDQVEKVKVTGSAIRKSQSRKVEAKRFFSTVLESPIWASAENSRFSTLTNPTV